MGKHGCGGQLKKAAQAATEKPKLAFRSFGNGRLDAKGNDVAPKIVAKPKEEPSAETSKSKDNKQVPTTKPKEEESRYTELKNAKNVKVTFGRCDKNRSDLVVSQNSVARNLVKYTTQYRNGVKDAKRELVYPAGHNFLAEIEAMDPKVKTEFFANAAVEILIDVKTPEDEEEDITRRDQLDGNYKSENSALDILKQLGPEFIENVTKVTVVICHPKSITTPTASTSTKAKDFNIRITDTKGLALLHTTRPIFSFSNHSVIILTHARRSKT